MGWDLSPEAEQACRRSRGFAVRATAYSPTYGTVPLDVAGGSVVVDRTSQVRRQATLVCSPTLFPDKASDILSPYGTEVFVEYGIPVAGRLAPEWVPLIMGIVQDAAGQEPADNDAATTITLLDRSSRIAEDTFDQTRQTIATNTVVQEIVRLITQTDPNATVIDLTGSTQLAARMEIEKERWADGVEKLAAAISAEVFCDPIGRFVIRPVPTLTDPVVWRIRPGDGGELLQIDKKRSRTDVRNRVVIRGQRADGTATVRAIVEDTDPNSPTRFGGPFGKKKFYVTSALVKTQAQATAMGQSILAQLIGYRAGGNFATLVNPAWDVGDVMLVGADGSALLHIADKFTIPLGPTDSAPLETRTTDLPAES